MQHHPWPSHWRAVLAVPLLLAFAIPTPPVAAQDAGAVVSIDTPLDAQTTPLGNDLLFTGWAAHSAGPGTGVDRVVLLDAPVAAGGQTVAEAAYGTARPDVGEAYGEAWTNSEFKASWKATGSPGNRTFWVYAHSPANDGWTNKTVTVLLTEAVQPSPPMGMTGQPGGQVSGQYPGTSYVGQPGSQLNTAPYSGQYGGQAGAPQYAPGSPYGAVPQGPYPGAPANGYAGGQTYGGYGASPLSGGYGASAGGQTYGGYGASPFYGGYGAAPGYTGYQPQLNYGGYGASPFPGGFGGSSFYGGYPPSAANCLGPFSPYGSFAYGTGYPSYSEFGCPPAYGVPPFPGMVPGGALPGVSTGVAPPSSISAASTSSTTVTLSWTPSVTPGVTNYQVSQASSPDGPFVPSVLSNLTTTGATVGGLAANTTTYFQVSAVMGGVASAPSATVSALTTT